MMHSTNELAKTEKLTQNSDVSPKTMSEPLLRSPEGSLSVQAEWLVAMLPICLWSFFIFGGRALLTELTAIAFCMGGDVLIRLLRRKKFGEQIAPFDLTAALAGLFIAFWLPSDCPLLLIAAAGLLSACIGGLFGGMSGAPFPVSALTVCLMRLIFPAKTAVELRFNSENGQTVAEMLRAGEKTNVALTDLLLGRSDGMVGEIASLLILLAALYLMVRGHIGWQIPVAWLLGGGLIAYLLAPDTMSVYYFTGAQLLNGGFLLAGCLVAPDRSYAPITLRAGLLLGFVGGGLTILFRMAFGIDGALLSTVICSWTARPLDRLLAPAPFGGRQK